MNGALSPLLVDRDGPVAVLTLNRPDRLNAVSLPLYEALVAALHDLEADRSIRAIVLTGAGRAFCAGADLKAHAEGPKPESERRRYIRAGQRANRALQRIHAPVVAAVNGHAIGAGLELALSCDFLIVAAEARLRFPEVALGTFVGGGVTRTLPERVGLARARELILLGEFFGGEDAAAMGLANRALPAAEVLDAARDLAARLAAHAPVPMALAKRLLARSMTMGRGEVLRAEAAALARCMGTADWLEGVRAAREQRPPRYTGE